MEQALFAAGDFNKIQDIFAKINGIVTTRIGYSGGIVEDPSPKEVENGNTGHAETVEVIFNPEKVSYEQLLDTFFMSHNPTTKDSEGSTNNGRFKSVIFYNSVYQKEAAENAKERHQDRFEKRIQTHITPMGEFYEIWENQFSDSLILVIFSFIILFYCFIFLIFIFQS